LPAHYSPHWFRATGVTNFLENDGTLEAANSRPAEKHGKELLDQRRTALDAILPSRIRFLPLTAIERVNL
jgi:hypothetical protein